MRGRWARTRQLTVNGNDDRLYVRAKLLHPHVAWWWGRGQSDKGHLARCYICDVVIAKWSSINPMTMRARQAVDAHRELHLSQLATHGRVDRLEVRT